MPPPGNTMERYPVQYVTFFHTIESHLVTTGDVTGDALDEDMIQVYATMRGRPDGRSLGVIHDCVWQAACLALELRSYSESEYGAVFRQLTRSVRRWRDGLMSRNYLSYLRDHLPMRIE